MGTAIEWLYEELWKQTDFSLPSNILEKAKEMEKQQIIDAVVWFDNTARRPYEIEIDAEQYYNETFKSE